MENYREVALDIEKKEMYIETIGFNESMKLKKEEKL